MAKIQEQRQKLEAKLKEMAEDGVMKTPQKDTLAFDPPDEEDAEENKADVSPVQKEKQQLNKEKMPILEETQDKPLYKSRGDRKSTRLNSSHANISYAVFCLKKKKKKMSRDNIAHKTRMTR